MRRAVTHIPVAFLTFLAGLLAHVLWPAPVTSLELDEPLEVSFCDLARDYERYDGKVVRVRAVLDRDTSPLIYDWSCGPPHPRMSPRIELTGGGLPDWAIPTLCCGSDLSNCPRGPVSAEVVVIGTFKADSLAPNVSPGFRQPAITPRSIFTLTPAGGR